MVSVIADIVTRYDIDGIHFDDYFYPNAPFNDDAAYLADSRGFPATTAGRADWRRDNVTMLIKRIYETIATLKPWVKFGVSPTGIYRSSTNPAIGSTTSSGALQHYSTLYADTKLWLQQGWVDYLAPQVYWFIGQTGSDYKLLVPWWNDLANNGRHIYIGQATYKVSATATDAWGLRTEYPKQMRLNREVAYANVYGEIAFRTAFLRSNPLNVRDSIRLNIYKKPALPPTMSWRDATPPPAPSSLLAVKQSNNGYVLTWNKPDATDNEMNKVRQFVIYRSENPQINLADTANLLAITNTDVTTYTDNANPSNKTFYYVVTSVDRLYNESAPSNVTDQIQPNITCPSDQALTLDTSCTTTLPDYTALATVSDDVSTREEISITQSPVAGTVIHGIGTTSVTLMATDASGKAASCTFVVKAEDKEPPVIMPLYPSLTESATIEVATDAGKCFFKVLDNKFDITATDNCSGDIRYSYTLTLNGITGDPVFATTLKDVQFLKGITLVTWMATDKAGNTSQYHFSINVLDKDMPVISSPETIKVSTDQGTCGSTVTITTASATDNCGIVNITGTRSDELSLKAPFPKGITTIIWTATDAAGNETSTTQTVTVEDHESPSLTPPAAVTVTTDAGKCEASGVSLGAPVFTDNCASTTISNNAPAIFPRGTTTVTWTATDAAGNQMTATQSVIVQDVELPKITYLPVVPLQCYNDRNTYTMSALTATDNCAIQSISYNISGATIRNGNTANASGVFYPGTSTITWIVRDVNGNVSTGVTTVHVNRVDVTIPDAYANKITASIGNPNTVYVGYGGTSITWNAQGTSTVTPNNLTYKWIIAGTKTVVGTGPVITVTPPIPQPGGTLSVTYELIVEDQYKCDPQTKLFKTITVRDIACGTGKIWTCQRQKDGSMKSLCVSATDRVISTLPAGSYLGSCTTLPLSSAGAVTLQKDQKVNVAQKLTLQTFPNPSKSYFTLVTSSGSEQFITIRVTDVLGRVIDIKQNVPANGTLHLGRHYRPGIYYVELIQGAKKVTTKLIKNLN